MHKINKLLTGYHQILFLLVFGTLLAFFSDSIRFAQIGTVVLCFILLVLMAYSKRESKNWLFTKSYIMKSYTLVLEAKLLFCVTCMVLCILVPSTLTLIGVDVSFSGLHYLQHTPYADLLTVVVCLLSLHILAMAREAHGRRLIQWYFNC